VGLRLFGIKQGEVDFFTPNNIVNSLHGAAPSGEAHTTGIITLWAESATFLNYPPITTWFQLDLIGKKGDRGDVQFTLGASVSL